MKQQIMRTKIHTKGFTLIELLVSMAIFSIMAGGMYLVFNNFSKVKEITDRDSKRLAELQRAFSFIHKDLSFIIPRPVKDEYGSQVRMNALVSDGDKLNSHEVVGIARLFWLVKEVSCKELLMCWKRETLGETTGMFLTETVLLKAEVLTF